MKYTSFRRIWKMILFILLAYGTLLTFYYAFTHAGAADSYYRYNWTWLDSLIQPRPYARKPRLLCAIMTVSANHKSKAAAVRDTWSKRCDSAIFFSSELDPEFLNSSLVVVNVTQGRDFLWEKTRTAFLHLEETYGNEFDWFLKSDDDTYFIIDNLRAFLSEHNPDHRLWFGCEFVHHTSRQHFPSGGAGYVLSRGAIRAFADTVKNETRDPTDLASKKKQQQLVRGCGVDGGSMGEDVRFSVCLESAGVKLIDAQGPNETFRFLPTMLEHFVFPEKNGGNGWITMYKRKLGQGIKGCCDSRLISIHYANPKLMYVYEFLIYHLKLPMDDL